MGSYVMGDWIGWANQHAKKFVAKWSGANDPEEAKILMTIGDLNLQQGTSVTPFRNFKLP